jgi:hypothetical protein
MIFSIEIQFTFFFFFCTNHSKQILNQALLYIVIRERILYLPIHNIDHLLFETTTNRTFIGLLY